ncbi:NUMOD1 domain-containing DNA-binding protein [Catalinimonas alkaloidigena]|uniref:NUMOD1 domain-containing DNA-binding protein n=1 Tax=Catalinimonas alkaloidigena TaxID=1075417 RepID=UPI002406E838|nr:NUMOD1 domain-containing DNA-binding protein [Catalinimonas alkaloidigena]
MEGEKITYIYVLKNPFSNEIFYIGKTIQHDRRLRDHIQDARLDRYSTPEMRKYIRDILALGSKPRFEVVYTVKPDQKWWDVERDFIREYRKKYKLFNVCDGGFGGASYNRLSEKGMLKLQKRFSKAVLCYDAKTGEFIQEYISAREAARQLNLFSNQVTQVCKGKFAHTGGFIFRYKKKYAKNKIAPAKGRGKKILQYDLNGNLLREWPNPYQVKKELKIHDTSVLRCCKGEQKTSYGFVWKFA